MEVPASTAFLRLRSSPGERRWERRGVAATGLIVAAEASHMASHGVLPATRGNGVPRFWGTRFLRQERASLSSRKIAFTNEPLVPSPLCLRRW